MTDTIKDDPQDLVELYDDLGKYDLAPLWTQTGDLMPVTPKPAAVPWQWRWSRMRALAERAGDLVPIERGGERRVLSLANPGLLGKPWATPTLWGALQFLGPKESAPAHRHTPGAIRFVLEGEGVWTLVDGDALPMGPGDLVLTPSMSWHEHHNPNDAAMLWFDGLDIPLVSYLDAVFFEDTEDEYAAENKPVADRSTSELLHGAPGVRPTGIETPTHHSPLMAYRWADTDRTLSTLADRLDQPEVSVVFSDPTTGRDALPTMRCSMHRLRVASRTAPVRTVGSSILVVFRGSGRSVIDGTRFSWQAGDMIVVPSWAAVEHETDEGADLFRLGDDPVIESLNLDRTAVLDAPQHVIGEFAGAS